MWRVCVALQAQCREVCAWGSSQPRPMPDEGTWWVIIKMANKTKTAACLKVAAVAAAAGRGAVKANVVSGVVTCPEARVALHAPCVDLITWG